MPGPRNRAPTSSRRPRRKSIRRVRRQLGRRIPTDYWREAWVLITKDKNVRRNQLEVEAILNSDVRAFVVTAANLNHEQIAQLVLKAMPKITRISRQQGPFVYNITATGIVSQIPHRTLGRRARPRGVDD